MFILMRLMYSRVFLSVMLSLRTQLLSHLASPIDNVCSWHWCFFVESIFYVGRLDVRARCYYRSQCSRPTTRALRSTYTARMTLIPVIIDAVMYVHLADAVSWFIRVTQRVVRKRKNDDARACERMRRAFRFTFELVAIDRDLTHARALRTLATDPRFLSD